MSVMVFGLKGSTVIQFLTYYFKLRKNKEGLKNLISSVSVIIN